MYVCVPIKYTYIEILTFYVHPLPLPISDNELPDYIMVMLANNKTVHQINNDLQLFLGENTERFTTWLQRAIADPAAMMERETETSQQRKKRERKKERGEGGRGQREYV